MLKLYVPAVVGVPVRPVEVNDRPGGNVPEAKLKLTSPWLPDVVKLAVYGEPTNPEGIDA